MDPANTLANNNLKEMLYNGQTKEAQEGTNDFLRLRAREDGFTRNLLPPESITPDRLTKQVETSKPCVVKDMEPNSAGALSVGFGTSPSNAYMGGPRYMVEFHRIMTKRYSQDVAKLMTYDMDMKDIFNDLLLKDLMDEEDSSFIGRIDSMLGDMNATDSTRYATDGACGYISAGTLNRESLFWARSGLRQTNKRLAPSVSLTNVTFLDRIAALDHDALGGSMAEEVFVNAWTKENITGMPTVATIKNDLVADNTQYIFAAPKYMGDFMTLEDVTVSFKREDYWISLFAYENIGISVKNTASACKVLHEGTMYDWSGSEVS